MHIDLANPDNKAKLRLSKVAYDKCWRVPSAPGIVMFNGHHRNAFIPHSHDAVTIVLVTKGAYHFQLETGAHIVSEGDMVVVGSDQIHSGRPLSSDGWEMRSLHIQPNVLAEAKIDLFRTNEPVVFSTPFPAAHTPASKLFLNMHRCAELKSEGGLDQQCEQLEGFFRWFGDNLDVFRPHTGARSSADNEIEQAKSMIMREVFDNIPIEFIAEEVGLSSYCLIRRFKRHYGIPPHAWRIQLRAKHVAQMLRNREPLVDIAACCGFADQAHMTRIFRSVYGVTPGQYRMA